MVRQSIHVILWLDNTRDIMVRQYRYNNIAKNLTCRIQKWNLSIAFSKWESMQNIRSGFLEK